MNLPLAAESTMRWILTYSLHSAVLGAAGLLAARIWLAPGSRRAVVLKVALFGALLSASVPWKAIAPLEFAGQAGGALADQAEITAHAGLPADLAPLAGARPMESAVLEGAALSGVPATLARPANGMSRLRSSAAWWMALVGGISVLLLGRMAFQRGRFLRSLGRRPLRDTASQALLAGWSAEAGTGAVALTASKNLRAPIALSSHEICVPQGCWDQLSDEARRALLAHEFAHIERKDPIWFMAAAALERVFFFLPWHRMVRERLNASAEVACDARAADRVGSTTSMARCLATVASWGAAAPIGHRVPASIPAMAAGKGELVARVRHLLDGDERPAGRRFGVGIGIALVGFACCAPAVTTMNDSDKVVPSSAFIGAIEVEVAANGMASARRSSDYPALKPIQADLSNRAGKDALQAWLGKAAADLEVWSAPKMKSAGMGSTSSLAIHDGTLVISAQGDVQLKYALWIMAMAGSMEVAMPDVRLRVNEAIYPVPLPVDIGLQNSALVQGIDVRIDPVDPMDPSQGVKYSVLSTERLAGIPPEEELIEEEEDVLEDEGVPQAAPPRPEAWTTFTGFVASAKGLIKEGKTLEVTVDGRKGTSVEQTTEVLDALIELGVTKITFKGSYEH